MAKAALELMATTCTMCVHCRTFRPESNADAHRGQSEGCYHSGFVRVTPDVAKMFSEPKPKTSHVKLIGFNLEK